MSKRSDARIKRIINNLLPATALEGQFSPPRTLKNRLADYHTPGVSIAVINNFELAWARGFGVCDARSKRGVTTKTLFQAGSISKAIFALGVLRLAQEGQLSLDQDIRHYLSAWRVPANAGWEPNVTLRQLLSHTAGLTVHGFPGYGASEKLPTLVEILNGEFPANTAKVEVNILPGTQFRYSGGGTIVAQEVLVELLTKRFPQIMHELVLEPLGLIHSTYEQPLPKRLVKGAATAHPQKGIPLKGKFHTYPEMAAAGLWTTATDLAKVGVELLTVLHDRAAPIVLSKRAIETMLQPQLRHQHVGKDDFVGLGFFCAGKDDGFHFGHDGGNEGFVARMRLYQNTGKGAVIMINSNEGYPLLDEIMHAIAKEYDWPSAVPKKRKAVRLVNARDYVGRYSSESGTQFRISVIDDNLMLHFEQQLPLPIFPSTEVDFFAKAINADIRFERNNTVGVVALIFSNGGGQIRALKESTEHA